MPLVLIGFLVIAAIGYLVVSRMNEIFCVSIRDGQCLVVRGHVSPALWRELTAVVRLARVDRGTVRAIKDGGRPRLVTRGLDEGTTQRLRNAFGSAGFGGAKASAPRPGGASRNLGQLLGFAWLAWLFVGRRP
ncbi:MAG: DUF3634 family protein [Sandaracinaceae bacterium]